MVDASAPGNQQPTILMAPNDIPLVNIQTPSPAGVSRNTYTKFDIEQSGVILNNSRGDVQTQLGGWVEGNPWLGESSARVILNEVNSLDPSLLKGYMEVAGDGAEVVIANPAGITCDGCGFIHAHRATLSTGVPILSMGDLEGYTVRDGIVRIQGNGMDARTTDYAEIIARAEEINAGLWANYLKVVAGVTDGPVPAPPVFGIDVAELGGMYAGQIFLMSSESGVGVSNAGKLYASAGDLIITADGKIENKENARLYGDEVLIYSTSLTNESVIAARDRLTVTVSDSIHNQENAKMFSAGDLSLTATDITNESGSIEGFFRSFSGVRLSSLDNRNPDRLFLAWRNYIWWFYEHYGRNLK